MRADSRSIHLITADFDGSELNGFDVFGYSTKRWLYLKSNRTEHIACHHALGRGHRLYQSGLKRFCQPDRYSPFSRGGLNCYAYCLGDPINRYDPTGRASIFTSMRSAVGRFFNRRRIKAPLHSVKPPSYGTVGKLADSVFAVATGTIYQKPLQNSARQWLPDEILRYSKLDIYDKYRELDSTFMDSLSIGEDYKYVVSNKGKLIASLYNKGALTHAALASWLSPDSNVVAAGYLRRTTAGTLLVDNTSGHYMPGHGSFISTGRALRSQGIGMHIVEKTLPNRS